MQFGETCVRIASEGRARRVYGRALPFAKRAEPISVRIGLDAQRKQRLARAASSMIGPAEVIFLDSSSTNVALAEVMPLDRGVIVATNID